jgi:hypothetical protein
MTQTILKASFISGKLKWLAVATLFAFCVGPTFISYRPYEFMWDDADYLERAVAVSRAFWSWNLHGIGSAMVSIHPPAMTLLGLPWGPMRSWDGASNCFLSLAAATSALAALCLYLLLRIGAKPIFLATASVCVVAAIGPYPAGARMHEIATGFMADSLLAWTTVAAILLIPYEARVPCVSIRGAILRGVLWGSIFSLGVLTKLNFLYFIALITPSLFVLRLRRGGLRTALAPLIACACWSAPAAFYLLRWGRPAFEDAKGASFGKLAGFYYIPLSQFLGNTIRESPGLLISVALVVTALAYLLIKRRKILWGPDFLALLIVVIFGLVVLASHARLVRYTFPVIIAVPFLTAILMSTKGQPIRGRFAALLAGLVFCGLLAASVPTRHRASRGSFSRYDAVMAEASRCNAQHMLLATDSPTLNMNLIDLATEFGVMGNSVKVGSLAYNAIIGVPIDEDFHEIDDACEVVIQEKDHRTPFFTNQRASAYERYVRDHGYDPVKVGDDLTVYSLHRKP